MKPGERQLAPALAHASTYRAPAGRHAAPHRYQPWKLVVYRSGRIRTWVDDSSFDTQPGSVLVVPPQGAHAERADTGYANSYLLVHAPANWPWPRFIDRDLEIARLVDQVVREFAGSDELSAALCAAMVVELDLRLRRHTRRDRPSAAAVAQAETLMSEHAADRVRISTIAEQLGLATSTLRAYFQAERGCSPQARLTEIRLRLAETLFTASDLPVEVVAQRSGFDSASHLRRHLRARRGLTPTQIRSAPPTNPR